MAGNERDCRTYDQYHRDMQSASNAITWGELKLKMELLQVPDSAIIEVANLDAQQFEVKENYRYDRLRNAIGLF